MIEITLPWPPSLNTYYTVVRARKVLSKKGRIYKNMVVYEVSKLLMPCPMDGGVAVQMFFQAPDRRRRDLSNHVKGLEDALTKAGVWHDDSQVDQLGLYRVFPPQKPGRVRVIIDQLRSDYTMEWSWE